MFVLSEKKGNKQEVKKKSVPYVNIIPQKNTVIFMGIPTSSPVQISAGKSQFTRTIGLLHISHR